MAVSIGADPLLGDPSWDPADYLHNQNKKNIPDASVGSIQEEHDYYQQKIVYDDDTMMVNKCISDNTDIFVNT